MDDEDTLELEEFSSDTLFPKSLILVLGDSCSGKSCVVKKIIEKISNKYKSGTICTDKAHCKEFYSKFIESERLYSRYASILIKRIFYDYTYLVLDNIHYSKDKFDEIIDISSAKNNIVIFTSKNILKYDFNFLIICGIPKNIKEVFDYYLGEVEDFEFEDFLELLKDFTETERLVIKLGIDIEFFYI